MITSMIKFVLITASVATAGSALSNPITPQSAINFMNCSIRGENLTRGYVQGTLFFSYAKQSLPARIVVRGSMPSEDVDQLDTDEDASTATTRETFDFSYQLDREKQQLSLGGHDSNGATAAFIVNLDFTKPTIFGSGYPFFRNSIQGEIHLQDRVVKVDAKLDCHHNIWFAELPAYYDSEGLMSLLQLDPKFVPTINHYRQVYEETVLSCEDGKVLVRVNPEERRHLALDIQDPRFALGVYDYLGDVKPADVAFFGEGLFYLGGSPTGVFQPGDLRRFQKFGYDGFGPFFRAYREFGGLKVVVGVNRFDPRRGTMVEVGHRDWFFQNCREVR